MLILHYREISHCRPCVSYCKFFKILYYFLLVRRRLNNNLRVMLVLGWSRVVQACVRFIPADMAHDGCFRDYRLGNSLYSHAIGHVLWQNVWCAYCSIFKSVVTVSSSYHDISASFLDWQRHAIAMPIIIDQFGRA